MLQVHIDSSTIMAPDLNEIVGILHPMVVEFHCICDTECVLARRSKGRKGEPATNHRNGLATAVLCPCHLRHAADLRGSKVTLDCLETQKHSYSAGVFVGTCRGGELCKNVASLNDASWIHVYATSYCQSRSGQIQSYIQTCSHVGGCLRIPIISRTTTNHERIYSRRSTAQNIPQLACFSHNTCTDVGSCVLTGILMPPT
jgi:hypothetical protein